MSMNESMKLVKHKRVRGTSIKNRSNIREYMLSISQHFDDDHNTSDIIGRPFDRSLLDISHTSSNFQTNSNELNLSVNLSPYKTGRNNQRYKTGTIATNSNIQNNISVSKRSVSRISSIYSYQQLQDNKLVTVEIPLDIIESLSEDAGKSEHDLVRDLSKEVLNESEISFDDQESVDSKLTEMFLDPS